MKSNEILNFVNWYIDTKEGNGSNYINNNFNGDTELFRLNIIDYAIQYAMSYGHNLFEVDNNKIPDLIKKIEEDLYGSKTETSFKKYSESINRHMPKALLGKENYLKYLSIINQTEEYEPLADSLLNVKPQEPTTAYTKDELVANFFFRLTSQDRFYDFLYFPISVLKKLFYKNIEEQEFFDNWMKEQIYSIQFHTEFNTISFSDINSLIIRSGEVYVLTDNEELKLYSPVAGKEFKKKVETESLQNIVIDHIKPFETVLFELKNQLPILRGIHKILMKFNNGRPISTRNELGTPGNMFIERVRFNAQNIIDLKNELNIISSSLKFQMMDKKENLYKKKFD